MRNAFLEALFEVAMADERVTFITGDLGYRVVEKFMEQRPRQFLNAGVAEANMTGLAAGMALSGKVVFTYSIANFPTLRCLEQIRNDICYHDADVKIVSVGGGFSYGSMGATHHAIEDLAIMRALPNLTVVAPGDPVETRAATRALVAQPGPGYLRLGKAGEPTVHTGPIDFRLGKAIRLRDGRDLTLMSTGGMLATAVKVADRLAAKGLTARVVSMHTLRPLDEDAVRSAQQDTGALFTLEEHSVVGGLGGAVAELVAEDAPPGSVFKRIGMPSIFSPHMGSQEYLLAQHGLDPESIERTILTTLQGRRRSGAQRTG
jgi:transketolase